MGDLLRKPVTPFEVRGNLTVSEALDKMGDTSFQARNLSLASEILEEMVRGETTVFLGLAGAMVPAGMRRIITYLIQERFIDCLVSTGANLFHDCVETLGRKHWHGSPHVDDVVLHEQKLDRIYDVFAREDDFVWTGKWIRDFAGEIADGGPYSTREFLYALGSRLAEGAEEDGILSMAAKKDLPIYCPAISDSSIGIELGVARREGKKVALIDVMKDVDESAEIAKAARKTGVVYIGGGTPKNFIQQTQVTLAVEGVETEGHDYAVQIITDPPHWGGLSGCTLEEAQSWGKVASKASKVTVYCDATIAVPLIVSKLADRCSDLGGKERVSFSMGADLGIKVN
jgi:deoxyhypusine synthase